MSTCKPCMAVSLKEAIRQFLAKADISNQEQAKVISQLDSIKDCPDGDILKVCECKVGSREKREPTAYNLFIGKCMSSKPIKGKPFGTASQYLKECALEWKKNKA